MSDTRPNVLFVIAEDVGLGDFVCYDKNGKIPTPNVMSLAKDGVVFNNAHATAALCAPSRYSLLTGNYPNRQINGNKGEWGFNVKSSLKPGQKTIANILQNNGYRTGIFGKTGIGGLYNKTENGEIDWNAPMIDGPNNWGFDYSFTIPRGHQWLPLVFLENDIPTCDISKLIRGQQACEIAKQLNCIGGGNEEEFIGWIDYVDPDFKIPEIGETLLTKVEKFLDQTDKNKPFFIHFCCDGAHTPYDPPESIRNNKILNVCKTRRDDMVYETDVLLGELRKILRQRNLEENTIICFTADHGAVSGDKGNMNFKMGKSTIYEGGVRIPLIINYPKLFLKGVKRDQLVCAMDIIPTILEILQIPMHDDEVLDAKSLVPLLVSKQAM
jgi:arylsulfatase A-like enzyme